MSACDGGAQPPDGTTLTGDMIYGSGLRNGDADGQRQDLLGGGGRRQQFISCHGTHLIPEPRVGGGDEAEEEKIKPLHGDFVEIGLFFIEAKGQEGR